MKGPKYTDWRKSARPGDVVMVCKHLWQDADSRSACRVIPNFHLDGLPWQEVYAPNDGFSREDGTKGKCRFLVVCDSCAEIDSKQVDLIETVWDEGRLRVADFCRNSN